jgi:hypothetical protein
MFEVGDLIKARDCWFEQQCGIPEYGIVIGVENRESSIKNTVIKGVHVMWMPHKQDTGVGSRRMQTLWHLANRMVKVA